MYVPGGRAAYPSTVLMNAIPARVAGVERVAMVTPPGRLEPAVLAAAREAGVSEIWRVGGAQACAALAFGAGPIRPVDKIVGPGNAYVTAAKRRLYGIVGIDALAGPSEIVVVADAQNDPAWLIDLKSNLNSPPDFVYNGHFQCAIAQMGSDSIMGAWGFTEWSSFGTAIGVLFGMTALMLVVLLVLLKRRDPV